jgi:hypothetical protein
MHVTTSNQFRWAIGVCASVPQVNDLIGAPQFIIIPFWSQLSVRAAGKTSSDLSQSNWPMNEHSLMRFAASFCVLGNLSSYSNIIT